MTKLVWDSVGVKRYESGVDRGVLYLSDGSGVAWNGITAVDDSTSVSVNSYYMDGVKYLTERTQTDYTGTLKAITYPDEFLQFDGYIEKASGMYLADQPAVNTFGLSYRTKMGNDINGFDYAYKVHILYNLMADVADKSFATLNASSNPEEFSWALTGSPISIPGFRPTAHVIFDSRRTSVKQLAFIESVLYGSGVSAPRIPTIADLSATTFDVIIDPLLEPV